jgi:hypothetical protein
MSLKTQSVREMKRGGRDMVQEELQVRNTKRKTALTTICATFLLLCCGPVFSQAGIDTGSVTGTVKDPTGALVVGATCTLINSATDVAQTALSTSAGAYVFPLVPVGTYQLTVAAKGFKEYVLTGIVVDIGAKVTEDVSLRVGAANTQVTVTSAAPILQAHDASVGTTFDSTAATELPLFGGSGGRNFQNLITVAAGVQFTGSNDTTGTFLANGVASVGEDVRLNGADDNVEVFGGVTIPPIPDTIQELKLEDGNNSADIGEFLRPGAQRNHQSRNKQVPGERLGIQRKRHVQRQRLLQQAAPVGDEREAYGQPAWPLQGKFLRRHFRRPADSARL